MMQHRGGKYLHVLRVAHLSTQLAQRKRVENQEANERRSGVLGDLLRLGQTEVPEERGNAQGRHSPILCPPQPQITYRCLVLIRMQLWQQTLVSMTTKYCSNSESTQHG